MTLKNTKFETQQSCKNLRTSRKTWSFDDWLVSILNFEQHVLRKKGRQRVNRINNAVEFSITSPTIFDRGCSISSMALRSISDQSLKTFCIKCRLLLFQLRSTVDQFQWSVGQERALVLEVNGNTGHRFQSTAGKFWFRILNSTRLQFRFSRVLPEAHSRRFQFG